MTPWYRSVSFWVALGAAIATVLTAVGLKAEAQVIIGLIGADGIIIGYLVQRGIVRAQVIKAEMQQAQIAADLKMAEFGSLKLGAVLPK